MPKFRFPLQKLLRLRAHAAQSARLQLAATLGELRRHETRLQELDRALIAIDAEAATEPRLLGLAGAVAGSLRRTRRGASEAHDRASRLADRARDEYQRLRSEHEALARLRATRLEAWRSGEAALAQRELEELARLRGSAAEVSP